MNRRRRDGTSRLEDWESDSDLVALAKVLYRSLPPVSPPSDFSQGLGRELVRRAHLRSAVPTRSVRALRRPWLLAAAMLPLLGAALYYWQSRSSSPSLTWAQRKA